MPIFLDSSSTPLIESMLMRIAFAAVCGALIGFERDVHGRAAGLRTHLLVSAGSALFAMASILLTAPSLWPGDCDRLNGDVCRIAAQIVTGVGFLGAGTIVKDGFTVKGLTTAACLWFVAALGITCGIGLIIPAILITILGLLTIFLGKQLEKKLHRLFPFQLIVEVPDMITIKALKEDIASNPSLEITSINVSANRQADKTATCRASFFIDANRHHKQTDTCLVLTEQLLKKFPDIISLTYKCEG